MPACKVCGRWFAKIRDDEELCDKCGTALIRLSGYAVSVVQCKDCRYFKMYKCRMGYSNHDDFCSHGERKEE